MTALAELQRRFRAALLEGDESGIERDVRHDGLSAAKRLQIYRNNARLLLTEALKANFPATCRIADERFFAYAAAEFIRRHPPRQPRLAEYGSELPDFLAGFAPAAGLPWLADLARLEWTMLECQEAADAPALRPPDLEADAHSIPQLRFERHPACRLLSSRWPVDRLRAFALSGGSEPPPAIGGEPVRLLVRRSPDGVSLRRLPESEFALLSGLFAGVRLEEALEGLGRDPAPLLAAALRDGLFARLLPKS